jgi:transcriptional regulator with XRE-family HTH domain
MEPAYLPVSEQIKILFEGIPHAEGRPYTLSEVSEGTGISTATLSQMRSGRIQNPQLNTLRQLCHFFGVPLRYFETTTADECYALLASPDSPPPAPVSEIAFRASRLSPEAQRDILTIIQWLHAAEQATEQNPDLPPLPRLSYFDDAR